MVTLSFVRRKCQHPKWLHRRPWRNSCRRHIHVGLESAIQSSDASRNVVLTWRYLQPDTTRYIQVHVKERLVYEYPLKNITITRKGLSLVEESSNCVFCLIYGAGSSTVSSKWELGEPTTKGNCHGCSLSLLALEFCVPEESTSKKVLLLCLRLL